MSSRKSMPVWRFFVLALTAQGCAGFPQTGPDYAPPDESIPDYWTGPAERVSYAAPNAQWRRVFNDPVLDGLIADGFAHNYDLAILRANLRRARAHAISLMKSVGGAPVRPDSSLIRNGV